MKSAEPIRHTLPRQQLPEKQAARRITAVELFAGARELRIAHDGEEYRLNITRSGKLILTK